MKQNRVFRQHNRRALQIVGQSARTEEEMLLIYAQEMGTYNALQHVQDKNVSDIEVGALVVKIKIGATRLKTGKFDYSGFTPEEGDIVRGAFENFPEMYVPGFGVVTIENLAEALGRKESSVIAAMRWIIGQNLDRLTREIPGQQRTVDVLQAIG